MALQLELEAQARARLPHRLHGDGADRARNILEYTTFVGLFPHLIAGPIVRFTDLAGQLRRLTPRLTSRHAALGVFFLSCGLVKKLLIADQLHPYVTRLYSNHAHLGFLTGWAAAIGYSLQLYFDFSGYSDMAVGLAWLLGFRFRRTSTRPSRPRTSPTSGAAGT